MSIKSPLIKIFTNINKTLTRILTKREGLKFTRENLYSWMNLTKKERFNLSKKDSMIYLTERKNLLNQIRNEYKSTIKKNNF